MILENKSLDERSLNIFEEDLINGGRVLVLTIYCTKVDNGLWQFPQPQIINENIYNRYKEAYDNKILAFRNDCENFEGEKGSILATEIETLKEEAKATQNIINDLLFTGVSNV